MRALLSLPHHTAPRLLSADLSGNIKSRSKSEYTGVTPQSDPHTRDEPLKRVFLVTINNYAESIVVIRLLAEGNFLDVPDTLWFIYPFFNCTVLEL